MKKIISILIISAILTGCGHISEDKPYVVEETTTASQNTETTASDAIDTTTSAVTVTNEVTRKNSSQSVTEKTAESVTTAAANTDIQPKKESKQSQNSQDNGTPEVKKSESQNTTKAQTSPPRSTTAPAVKENKTTTTVRTSPPVVTTKAPQTTMPAKPITTAPPITTAEIYTEPAKMNITEHWLTYFSDSHNKDYYVNVGSNLSNDGSDSSKVQAVFEYVTANFSNDNSCTYMSAVTMCLCEGIGLDCKYALISDWYAHCANAVNVDGVWYVLDTQAGGFLCGNFGFTSILDEYENELSVTLSDNDYE